MKGFPAADKYQTLLKTGKTGILLSVICRIIRKYKNLFEPQ